jgi:transcriptional regulator with XRE-family HTH domain
MQRTLSEVLRQAVKDSGESLRTIEAETNIDVASLSRFVRGERTLYLDRAERLAEYLGLVLVKQKGR